MIEPAGLPELKRIPSGIPGLDLILNGGFLEGGIYIIMGRPGAGKTILGNQICFGEIARGGSALYLTLLAESHGRMITHLRHMTFFDGSKIPGSLTYLSGYKTLENDGLKGLLELVRGEFRKRAWSMVIIDGLVTAEAVAGSDLEFKKFIHELQVFGSTAGCTTFLLTNQTRQDPPHAEHTMVDGIVELCDLTVHQRSVRVLYVQKFRGSAYLRGRHVFEISESGLVVYPRTEALLSQRVSCAPEWTEHLPFGVPRFDEMLGGGLVSGSTTLMLGPPGSGKTIFGLQFLATGAAAREPGLYFGFFESTPRITGKAEHVGIPFQQLVDQGMLHLKWHLPVELLLDELAATLLAQVRATGTQRLFIDGLDGFTQSVLYPERIPAFFTALLHELRVNGVTTIFSVEAHDLFAHGSANPAVSLALQHLSTLVENIVILGYETVQTNLERRVSILKVREAFHDTSIRRFTISDRGIQVCTTKERSAAAENVRTTPVAGSSPPSTRKIGRSRRKA